ncbi:hypothetical protein ACFQO7_34600 [Catellatospora aurea]|uniref:Uncharacterized protein n=1 Tax=Catellatospora aurea TaxID=1337874 RepID=A0ABW2H5R9_9ACTN
MQGTTYGSALAEPVAETREELRFVRAMNAAHAWDTSLPTIQRILDFLTREAADER